MQLPVKASDQCETRELGQHVTEHGWQNARTATESAPAYLPLSLLFKGAGPMASLSSDCLSIGQSNS